MNITPARKIMRNIMRNELEIKKHIAKINFITQLERIVLYPPLFDGSTIVDFDLLYPESKFEEFRRQKYTAKVNKDGKTLNKRSIRQV